MLFVNVLCRYDTEAQWRFFNIPAFTKEYSLNIPKAPNCPLSHLLFGIYLEKSYIQLVLSFGAFPKQNFALVTENEKHYLAYKLNFNLK